MKIRNGFVSNSSSSSFLIKKNERFPDTVSIAENMIIDLIKDYTDYGHNYPDEKIYDNIKYLKNNYSNVPIMFRSTNYDTYIVDIGEGYFFIDTCNNVNWDIKKFSENILPDELKKMYNDTIELYDSTNVSFDRDINLKYFKLDSGFFIQNTNDFKWCEKCYNELFKIDDKIYCLNCDQVEIYRYFKLNKINKKINDNIR